MEQNASKQIPKIAKTFSQDYVYTKIVTEIVFKEFLSDFPEYSLYNYEFTEESFDDSDCYINDIHLINIHLEYIATNKFKLSVIAERKINEYSVENLINAICERFALNLTLNYTFQHCGIIKPLKEQFNMSLSYAKEDMVFEECVLGTCSTYVHCTNTFNKELIMQLDKKQQSEYTVFLNTVFIDAMSVQSVESRFIQMYYIFELILNNPKNEYQPPKQNTSKKFYSAEKIFFYLSKQMGIKNYSFISSINELDFNIIKQIVDARNELVHFNLGQNKQSNLQGTESKKRTGYFSSQLLYEHFIPIVKEYIKKINHL